MVLVLLFVTLLFAFLLLLFIFEENAECIKDCICFFTSFFTAKMHFSRPENTARGFCASYGSKWHHSGNGTGAKTRRKVAENGQQQRHTLQEEKTFSSSAKGSPREIQARQKRDR
uniref:(northern house mosquito) hypothetical protein n=1 Tax=Culex pipiens TaxID=7175 RepID=A0A8D8K6K9_CULPI